MRKAFTLVELLVVVTIIGILIALTMPAVQSARETARRTQCANHIKQLALGVQQHLAQHSIYPTGGWGWDWVGDPDRGYRKSQPGGWVYNILAFVDQTNLRELGAGEKAADKKKSLLTLVKTPLPFANCPTRRRAVVYPAPTPAANNTETESGEGMYAKGDYAMCSGGQLRNEIGGGPPDLASGDKPDYKWTATPQSYSGISFERSEITSADVRDGESYTIMIGEKYLDPDYYAYFSSAADNETLYSGFDNDNWRCTNRAGVKSGATMAMMQDRPGYSNTYIFGSAHSGSCNFAFCDGSVRTIPYSIDPIIFEYLGSRADGENIDLTAF